MREVESPKSPNQTLLCNHLEQDPHEPGIGSVHEPNIDVKTIQNSQKASVKREADKLPGTPSSRESQNETILVNTFGQRFLDRIVVER